MKSIYKTFIACLITAIITAFVTGYIVKQRYEWSDTVEYLCAGNAVPDSNGCCPDENYTDMGDQGFNCCPTDGNDCFPPIR